jgi:hypothetical protein
VIEVLFNTMFTPPGLDPTFTETMLGGVYLFRLDSLVAIMALLKVYHFIRLYVHYSPWLTGETHQICKKFGFVPDLYFVVKTELKQRPFKVLFIGMIMISVISALII